MLFKKKIISAALGAIVSLGLVACGSDSDTTIGVGATTTGSGASGGSSGDGTGTTETGSSSNPARTIKVSYPVVDAIVNKGGGIYSQNGSVLVTDSEGDPVPDGTRVYFSVTDSILARGTISNGDSATGTTFTDAAPLLGDAVWDKDLEKWVGSAVFFDQAYVYRNSAFRFIEPGDHIFLKHADEQDKNRIISAGDGAISANTLAVTSVYDNDYPNTVYPADESTEYSVGASTLGAEIVGRDACGEDETCIVDDDDNRYKEVHGYSVTKNGIAEFSLVYPADIHTLRAGCKSGADSSRDLRFFPYGSAEVFLIASAGEHATTVVSSCFSSIAPWQFKSIPEEGDFSGGGIRFFLRDASGDDGGGNVRLAYTRISSKITPSPVPSITGTDADTNTGGMTVSVKFYNQSTESYDESDEGLTDGSGVANVLVTVEDEGDTAIDRKAEITFYAAADPDIKKVFTITRAAETQ